MRVDRLRRRAKSLRDLDAYDELERFIDDELYREEFGEDPVD